MRRGVVVALIGVLAALIAVMAASAHHRPGHCNPAQGCFTPPPPPPVPPPPPPPPPPAPSTTFYVDPFGSDANPGSAEAPWRTLQHAIDTLEPGQAAIVRAGFYAPFSCGIEDGGSTLGEVSLVGEGFRTAVVQGSADGLAFVACDFLRIEQLAFAGPSCVGCTNVWMAPSATRLRFLGNEVSGAICQGVYIDQGSSFGLFRGNYVHDNGTSLCDRQAHGFYVEGFDHLIESNLVTRHPQGFDVQMYDNGARNRLLSNTLGPAGYGRSNCCGAVVAGGGSSGDYRDVEIAFNVSTGSANRLDIKNDRLDGDCTGDVHDNDVEFVEAVNTAWGSCAVGNH